MRSAGLLTNLQTIKNLAGSNSESMLQLGVLMRKGMPMAEALHQVAMTATSRSVKAAASLAAQRLSSGESGDKVFASNEMTIFPPAVRYILAAPLKDETRGRLIADWRVCHKNEFRLETALIQPLQTMMVGLMSSLSLFMFVIPQMREIFSGLSIETPPYMARLFGLYGSDPIVLSVFIGIAFAAVVQLAIFLARRLSRFSQMVDEVNLLRMLAVLTPEERVPTVNIMAVKLNFPLLHGSFRYLARSLAGGSDIDTAGRAAGISDLLAWFVALGLQDKNPESHLLLQASEYVQAGIESSVSKTITLLEVSSTLFMATIFGSLAYTLVQMMILITEGCYT